jgi:thiamine biosynthesis lipoprotein
MRARLTLFIWLALAASCSVQAPSEGERFEGETMGTTYVVRLAQTISESDRLGVARAIDETLASVNARMSNYLPDSEISRFNRAENGVPVPVSRETFEVVSEARRVSEMTGGAFDVTVSPLVRLWGFGPGGYGREGPPTEEEIARAKGYVGFRNLVLADDPITLTKLVPELECDLSAIAKGYGVDRVAEALEARGYRDYMVEVGGEVRTLGKNSVGHAWRIAIEKPLPGTRAVQRIVSLSGFSMATSGDYRNFYELDGKIHSHLIDPRTGRPVSHRLASVSVLSQTAMRADALASGLLVLGPEDGFDLAVAEDLAVLFLSRTEEGEIVERATPAFAELFPD